MRNNYLRTVLAITVAILFIQCHKSNNKITSTDVLPAEPDYKDLNQWYISDRHADADVFYITSTETGDYTLADGITYHFADTYNDSVRRPLYSEMLGVDTLVSGKLNYYSPYYRQCSLQTFTSDSLLTSRMPVALDDIRKAFRYYLNNLNNGRPFILAGFSQGAMILLELLKEMDEDTYGRLIAAYAIGTTIPRKLADNCPYIVPAKGAGDTGVTICYNSIRDTSCTSMFPENSAFAINPVNWQTDVRPAVLLTETSPFLPVTQQKKEKLTIHLDEKSKYLIVEGYTGTDYILPLIGQEGCYHSREIWFYRQQLCENMALRAANFLKKSKR
jgi:hypothetical protein